MPSYFIVFSLFPSVNLASFAIPVESIAIFASSGSNNKLRHEVRSVEAALPQTKKIRRENASEKNDRHGDPMVDQGSQGVRRATQGQQGQATVQVYFSLGEMTCSVGCSQKP